MSIIWTSFPNYWNVFIGDMSFIGPRPERKFYIDQIMERDPRYRFLYQIRPGVTSYATLYNGYTGYAGEDAPPVCAMTCSIWSIARGGSISRYW